MNEPAASVNNTRLIAAMMETDNQGELLPDAGEPSFVLMGNIFSVRFVTHMVPFGFNDCSIGDVSPAKHANRNE